MDQCVDLKNVWLVGITCIFLLNCISGQVNIKHPADQLSTTNEGSRLTLVCSSTVDGLVEWTFNGTPLVGNDTKYTVHNISLGTSLLHYLTVSNVTTDDAGSYTCRQIYTDDVTIHVTKLNKLQLLEPMDESLTVEAGTNLTFVCLGDNAASISWYQSGHQLTSAVQGVAISVESNVAQNRQTSVLTRTTASSYAAGVYQCRDNNRRLDDSTNVTVYVRGGHVPDQHKNSASHLVVSLSNAFLNLFVVVTVYIINCF